MRDRGREFKSNWYSFIYVWEEKKLSSLYTARLEKHWNKVIKSHVGEYNQELSSLEHFINKTLEMSVFSLESVAFFARRNKKSAHRGRCSNA